MQSQDAGAPHGLSGIPLPEGVVVRGRESFAYGPTPEEAERAGRELANPFRADDAAALARGAVVFARFCTPCHGADGEGQGPAVLRGMLPPPSLKAERAVKLRDGQAFHVITKGQGNMASYAVQVAPEDRWKAILHVRVLQGSAVK
jgi:mono/diheme cytochrome c family protein